MYKIAFFGSDLFSLLSFKKVVELHTTRPDVVHSLSLITRPLKASGRNLKNIVKPEIVKYAEERGISWHQVEKAEEFSDLHEFSNLAVAVSYGRLIPTNYLKRLEYGGLNVHPSLLPQYRGSSPLQWAIMNRQKSSGVSVQTLHPTKFDHGDVLWQSPPFALDERETTGSLTTKLGEIGAQGLIDVLTTVDLLNPGPITEICNTKPSLAPLIDRRLHKIDFNMCCADLDARGRALDKLYFEQKAEQKQPKRGKPKGHPILRVNLSQFRSVDSSGMPDVDLGSVVKGFSSDNDVILCLKCREGFLGAAEVTVQGFKTESAEQYFKQLEKRKLKDVIID